MTLRSIDGGQARGAGPLREVGQASLQAVPAVPADPRPPQMPWLAVYLTVKDGEASLEFYRRAFGFLPGNLMRDDQGALMHAELHYKGEIPVMFTPETAPDCTTPSPATLGITMPVFFHFYHEDVDALFAQAKAAGAQVETEPTDMFWGERVAVVTCPNGYRWSFATYTGDLAGPPGGAAA
ncbi:MAG TPA: VOC family protein [Pedomonas sp.]|nr:VOC family protein [Pedomonas sp.]